MNNKKPILCHVCGKEKKPYTVIMNSDILSLLRYNEAREDGEICQRCDQYFAMTGIFKDATKKEFENAKKSCEFARMMLLWWEKDKKLIIHNECEENKREWEGTEPIKKWYREYLDKGVKND